MTQARLIIGLITAALLVALLVFGPQACNSLMTAKKQVRVGQGQAEAGKQSGEVADATVDDVAAAGDEIDDTVSEGKKDIDAAPVGKSNDAALRASCRLKTYKDTDQCKELAKKDAEKAGD